MGITKVDTQNEITFSMSRRKNIKELFSFLLIKVITYLNYSIFGFYLGIFNSKV
jgi:hypothetical protein